jgi:hypothetical protein
MPKAANIFRTDDFPRAHVVISCAYGSYRLREFDYCANLNTSIIPCMAGEYKTGEYFNINFN